MAVSTKTRNLAFKQLGAYIRQNKLRPTRVREAVLEQICLLQQPFTADQLVKECETQQISVATVYNTLNLLVLAQILCATSRQRGKASTEYEIVVGKSARVQVICTKCGRVTDIRDRLVEQIVKERKYSNFVMRHYSLFIYGECKVCRSHKRKEK